VSEATELRLLPSNQGRAIRGREPILWKGMVFATGSEVRFARALDAAGLFFAPLPLCRVTVDGGNRQTREVDFLVVHRGVPAVVEIDGRPHEGRAAEDHRRDRAVKRSGIWLIERFASVDVMRDAPEAVRTLQGMLRHYQRTA
jgi:hypothetical protein